MTTHFAGKFKGSGSTVSYCKQWALSPICGMTTTDKAQVTCKACAKKLGITPAAEVVVAPKNHSATCACCFNNQKVKPTGTMFKHGYTRPGYGYILGGCPGDMFAPYEVSVEGTVYMLDLIKSALVRHEAALEALKTATTITVTVSVYHTKDAAGYWLNKYIPESFTIAADDRSDKEYSYSAGDYVFGKKVKDSKGCSHFFNFAEAVAKQAKQLAQQIESIKADIAFFEGKVAGWVKAA